jgi:cytochrome c-type biogenesis protein CcmH/NrfF
MLLFSGHSTLWLAQSSLYIFFLSLGPPLLWATPSNHLLLQPPPSPPYRRRRRKEEEEEEGKEEEEEEEKRKVAG